MNVIVVGAGAIGGWIGTQLAAHGHRVGALARGATLLALKQQGWRLQWADGRLLRAPTGPLAERADELSAPDLLIIALKGPALPPLADSLQSLLGEHTLVLTAMNGVPWWFFSGIDGHQQRRLDSVDPGQRLRAAIPAERVIGGVVHATCSTPEPGLVQHGRGQGLIVGEAVGEVSERVHRLAADFAEAGLDVSIAERIQRDVWYKLWGNMTMNPVSALTGATSDRVLDDPDVFALCLRAMAEAAAIGERIGCPITQSGEERMLLARHLGAFKTSMLQDAEAGKPLEIDALLGAIREIGLQLGVPTPTVDGLFGLARLYARVHGLYPD